MSALGTFAWILASALGQETPLESPAALSARAADAYRTGRISEARALYESALARHERFAPALAGLGRIDQIEHHRLAAKRNLARAYQGDPNNPKIVRDYAAAIEDPSIEEVLLQRLILLKATSPIDRDVARYRLEVRKRLAGRVVNRLVSPYHPYQLHMPVAYSTDGRAHGWTLRVSINGRPPLRLLLDTGARSLLVSTRTANTLGLEPLAESHIGGFGDDARRKAETTLAHRLVVDDQLELANVMVEVADQRFVEGVDGLISTDLLRHFLLTCNGRKKQLELAPFTGHSGVEGSGERPWAGLEPPPLAEGFAHFRRLGHLIVMEDRTQPGAQYVLDTGAGYSIVHEPLPSLNAPTVTLVGASGSTSLSRKEQPLRWNLSGKPQWTREVLTMDLGPMSEDFGVRIAGLLGFPALRSFAITLDPRNGSLRIGK